MMCPWVSCVVQLLSQVMGILLDNGAAVDARDANGWSALHHCARGGTLDHRICLEMVCILFNRGHQLYIYLHIFLLLASS
jgi:ankyrin repeat protein